MRAGFLLLPLLVALWPSAAAAGEPDYALLRDRAVGLMRHGGAVPADPTDQAPVRGCDPSAMLTPLGRDEIASWGERLRAAGLGQMLVATSRQCSAMQTAVLLDLGPIEVEPALGIAAAGAEMAARTEALRRALLVALRGRAEGAGPVLFVTHRANIAALTGLDIGHGEVLLLGGGPGGAGPLSLLGRLRPE